MSLIATAPASELTSEDWQINTENTPLPISLIVQQRRSAHVLPYFRLLYVNGDNSRVQIAFATDMVVVNGHGLAQLIVALAAQRVMRLIEPTENEARFGVRGDQATRTNGAGITDIKVIAAE